MNNARAHWLAHDEVEAELCLPLTMRSEPFTTVGLKIQHDLCFQPFTHMSNIHCHRPLDDILSYKLSVCPKHRSQVAWKPQPYVQYGFSR